MRISAAAVRVCGKIFIGTTHFEATLKFINLPEMFDAKTEDGYVTDTGDFVNREQAYQLACAAGQADRAMADPKAAMAFYGTERPRLESSMITDYAGFKVPNDFV